MVLCLIFICGCNKSSNNIDNHKFSPKAAKGVIDLTNWDFEKDGMINLDGEWEFYWQKFIETNNAEVSNEKITTYINVPSIWNDAEKDGIPLNLDNDGFASYKLTILLNKSYKRLAIRMKTISTSYQIWINGQLISEAGKIGTSVNEAVPALAPGDYGFDLNSNKIEMVVYVSNYFYFHSGIWDSISLGTEKQARNEVNNYILRDMFTLGCIVILMFYYLGFYIFRSKEKSSLYFSFVCFSFMLAHLVANDSIFIYILGHDHYEIGQKIGFVGVALSCLSYPLLLNSCIHIKNSCQPPPP